MCECLKLLYEEMEEEESERGTLCGWHCPVPSFYFLQMFRFFSSSSSTPSLLERQLAQRRLLDMMRGKQVVHRGGATPQAAEGKRIVTDVLQQAQLQGKKSVLSSTVSLSSAVSGVGSANLSAMDASQGVRIDIFVPYAHMLS